MQTVKTSCLLILLAALLLNIPQTLQAKTVSDAAGRINPDKIIKDFIGNEEPGEPYKYYDDIAAVFLSVIPVYSGSWNTGFTPLGFVFVVTKSGGLAGFIGIFFGAKDFSLKENNANTYGFYTCLAVFLYSTIGDMIYSGVHINSYNRYMEMKSNKPDKMGKSSGPPPQVIIALEPRSSLIHDQSSRNEKSSLTVEGVDISVLYRF